MEARPTTDTRQTPAEGGWIGYAVDRSRIAAYAEEDRSLDEDLCASPEVHPFTAADLADEFTQLDLVAAPTSCG